MATPKIRPTETYGHTTSLIASILTRDQIYEYCLRVLTLAKWKSKPIRRGMIV